MIQTIASTAKISTKIIKDGSVAGRDVFAQKLEGRFYDSLEKCKSPKFDCICKNINKILPTKLIQVEKLPINDGDVLKSYNGAVCLAREVERTIPADIVGYIVALKPNCKKEHFGGVGIEVLMHEIHHLFSYLTHPKIPSRICKVSKLSSENENFEKFFVDNFQSPLLPSKCQVKTEKLLSEHSADKVDILQYLRYKLIDEIGAYRTGEKFADLHRTKHAIEPSDYQESMVQVLFLREKLEIISDMLKNILKAERK